MAATAKIGTSTTVTHTSFTGKILSIDGPNPTLETINASHMATTNYHDFIGTNLIDPGSVSMEIEIISGASPGSIPTVGNTASSLVITFPGASMMTAATAICVGYTVNIPLEDKITGTVEFKISGAWS